MILLGAAALLSHLVDQLHDRGKISRSSETNIIYRTLIYLFHTIDTVHFRIKNVAIKSKAVACFKTFNLCSVAKYRDLLIAVIILQDTTDRLNCIQILIISHITFVVKRRSTIRTAIRASKVYRNIKTDLTATKDILKEGVFFFKLYRIEGHQMLALHLILVVIELVLTLAVFDLGQGKSCLSAMLVLTRLLGQIKFNSYLLFDIIAGHVLS